MRNIRKIAVTLAATAVLAGTGAGVAQAASGTTYWYGIPTAAKCAKLGMQKTHDGKIGNWMCDRSRNGYTLELDWN
jgi:hypothetical protein